MRYKTLGKDLKVSAVGFGCMGMSHAYGTPLERKEAVQLIQQAVEMGYTFFDTAEVYGTADDPHVNEELVGKALADVKQQVEKDYLESQKQKLFAERGATLDAALAKAVAEGKSFADVAKASGAKVEAVKNFSLTKFSSTAPAVMNAYSVIRSELPKMKVGGVSKMQTLSKNGYIVNLVKFTKPSEPATAADYKKLAQNIEMAFSAFSSNTVVGDMIEKESGAAEAVE